ncbi:hypothetical protein FRC17_002523 [Serendipita sp. 399]|nr:hypothetical protein FRC17_002523 [Serendipita sp. 399]
MENVEVGDELIHHFDQNPSTLDAIFWLFSRTWCRIVIIGILVAAISSRNLLGTVKQHLKAGASNEPIDKSGGQGSRIDLQSQMSSVRALDFLKVTPTTKHTASVIFLHGLGDSGRGWAPVARMLSRNPKLSHIKWILPHAPTEPVTLNGGMRMPSWFDIESLDLDEDAADGGEDAKGMLDSSMAVNRLITAEIDEANIPANRIVVGGFSQGGALGLLTGLTSERKLAGLVSLSTWLPLSQKMKSMMTDSARMLPIFFGHGTSDPVVQYQFGRRSYEHLKSALGFPEATGESISGLTWREYDGMGHSASEEELEDLNSWLEKVLPAEDQSTS